MLKISLSYEPSFETNQRIRTPCKQTVIIMSWTGVTSANTQREHINTVCMTDDIGITVLFMLLCCVRVAVYGLVSSIQCIHSVWRDWRKNDCV